MQRPQHGRLGGKRLAGSVHREAKYIGDAESVPCDGQCVGVVTRAVAGGTRRVHAGQKKQFDAHEAFALAGGTAAFGDVERKAARVIASFTRCRCSCEELAHGIKQAGIGGKVGAGRTADRLLVHAHKPANVVCGPAKSA